MALTAVDPLQDFKAKAREAWSTFAPIEVFTTPSAAKLLNFAGVRPGQTVLDVGCGTGVVALTARRIGAKPTGLDLSPVLLDRAKHNAAIGGWTDVAFKEGDAEALPFPDNSFDAVVSQYGHMFAPRPDVAIREMLRVLRPGGTVAFSTWPPELLVGRLFSLVGKYLPPPPGVSPPPQWGDVAIVRERLGAAVRDLTFHRERMQFFVLSPKHYVDLMERTSGPILRVVQTLANDQPKLAAFRNEIEAMAQTYFADNTINMDYLMTRATKI